MKKFLKRYWIDLVVVGSLIVASLTAFLAIKFTGNSHNLMATIYSSQKVVDTINLNEEDDLRYIEVLGKHGKVKIGVKKDAIAIVESTCPNKDCVHMGFITKSNQTIVCAYNEVYITLSAGEPNYDVEV